nr:hypothetical protein GCM10020185_32010 [Pseudomonas brassicacearum subsp. brassicacearum]
MFEATVAEQYGNVDIGAQHVVVAFAGHQADVHLRVGGVKAMQARHQPVGGKGEVRGHLQHLMLVLGGDRAQPCIDALQAGLYLFKQDRPGLGQFDAAVDAVEQPRTQLLFQALDLLADGRLRGAQFNRRRGKALLARRGFKGAEQFQGQVTQGVIHKLCLS